MTAIAARPDMIELRAFSRRWWAAWHWRADHGVDIAPMTAAARAGRPWRVPAASVVSDVGLIPIGVSSPEFYAWQVSFERQGIRLPRPNRAAVVFMPAAQPPPAPNAGAIAALVAP